jgi:hypothetical protein
LLAKVHALLVGMLRSHPDLILDTCSVQAKRGGDFRAQPHRQGQAGHEVPPRGGRRRRALGLHRPTGANVNDTLVFERLFLAAFAVMARIRSVFTDKGYDAEHHRLLCRAFGAEPGIHKRG